ncbi:MAG: ferritin family protein, partial [candidate division WOR-3 bacterium]
MAIFEAKEIFKFAIRIEENGEKFYRFASTLTDDEETKKIFNYLADEEVKHKEIFTKLLSEITKDVSFENYSDEYFDYLRCYVDNVIFNEEQMEKQKNEVKDVLSAIKFAMQRELDSVLYYHEVMKFVSSNRKSLIEEIISEERKHYA